MNTSLHELLSEPAAHRERDFRSLTSNKPISFDAADYWLDRHHDSYQRGDALRRLQHWMPPLDLLRLGGKHWSGIDNVWQHGWIIRLLRTHGQQGIKAFMTQTEVDRWRSLPDVFTVWRGCFLANRSGVSFSIKREIAEQFPQFGRYQMTNETPILVEARVRRADCAIKLDRGEDEVVVLKRRVVRISGM